jgi:hypothetical protein
MCSLRFENNLLTIEGVRFALISKKTSLSKLSLAFVSLALPLLNIFIYIGCIKPKNHLMLLSLQMEWVNQQVYHISVNFWG